MLDQSRPRGATALCPPALCFSLPMARLRLPPGAPARVSRFGGFRGPSGVTSQGSWLSGPYVALTFLGHVGESICNSLRGIGEALSQRWHPSPLSCHQGQSFVTPLFVSRWRPHTQIPAVPDFSPAITLWQIPCHAGTCNCSFFWASHQRRQAHLRGTQVCAVHCPRGTGYGRRACRPAATAETRTARKKSASPHNAPQEFYAAESITLTRFPWILTST